MSEVLWAEAVLGRESEDFFKSDLGRYLLGRAEQEEQEASEKLASVASWRRRRIQQLQNEIWRARSVRQWLSELIQAGRQAEAQLDEDRSED